MLFRSTPHTVFGVNDELKVMIIDLDAERGRISLSTKQLEPEPGDMVKNPQLVYDKAEEMAERYRQQLLQKQQAAAGIVVTPTTPAAEAEEIVSAEETAEDAGAETDAEAIVAADETSEEVSGEVLVAAE